jgi:hypothetical protein
MEQLDMLTLNQSEESTDFLLRDHYAERIKYHMTMLNYYLKEEKKWQDGKLVLGFILEFL